MIKNVKINRGELIAQNGAITPPRVAVTGLSETQQPLFSEYIIDILNNRNAGTNGYEKS